MRSVHNLAGEPLEFSEAFGAGLRCSPPKTPSASPSTIAPAAIEQIPARIEKPFSRTAVPIIQTTIFMTRNARAVN